MNEPTLNHVRCPGDVGQAQAPQHRMAYWQWGDPASPRLVLCVHGMARQGRDFDSLARALCERSGTAVRVVCPDVVGRGHSDWLTDPMGYQIPNYVADMLALLAQLQAQAAIESLDWVGTSMGGLIGLILSGQPGLPLPAPVRRLVLNDVGPAASFAAIERIKGYLGQTVQFENLESAAAELWKISTSFGPHTTEQWLELTRHMVQPVPGSDPARLRLHYDPAIAIPLRATTAEMLAQGEAMLWALYDQIHAETLVLRGADSDLLTRTTALAMTTRGPCARLREFPGVGHAPTLIAPDQLDAVTTFLLAPLAVAA